MPNRILKESIWRSESLNQCSLEAQGFFMRLIPYPDDFGRFDARIPIIRASLYPLRYAEVTEKRIEAWLQEIVQAGMIRLYEVNGRPYGFFVNWNSHQQQRIKRAKFPQPPDGQGLKEKQYPLEADIEDLLFETLSNKSTFAGEVIIGVSRQVRVGESYIDLIIRTEAGGCFIIELKRSNLSNKAIEQVLKYKTLVPNSTGILIGEGLTANFNVALASENDIAVISYNDLLSMTLNIQNSKISSETVEDLQVQNVISRENTVDDVSSLSESEIEIESESKNPLRPTFQPDGIEVELSTLLFEKIQERNPNQKKPNFQTWARDIHRMIELDSRDPTDIRKVVEWCQGDPFWQNNILSTLKLRQQYDQLWLKMQKGNGHGSGNSRSPTEAFGKAKSDGEPYHVEEY